MEKWARVFTFPVQDDEKYATDVLTNVALGEARRVGYEPVKSSIKTELPTEATGHTYLTDDDEEMYIPPQRALRVSFDVK